MKKLAARTLGVNPSPTFAIDALAKKMKASGIDVIVFGVGEPDFDTPVHVKKAAEKALEEGFTKYTPSNGIEELRKAICDKFKKDNSLEYTPDQVLVSCGAKHSLWNSFQALVGDGDEVLVPTPYWVSYIEQIRLCGGKPVFVNTSEDNGFAITADSVAEKISKNTKVILLNSPNNPTGAVYDEVELKKIGELAVENDCYIISDEIYEKLVYGKKHVSIASLGKEIKDRTIVVNGFSKAYAMTGWRVGYAAGPIDVIRVMGDIQSNCVLNPASFAQKGAVAALTGPQDCVREMAEEFNERRKLLVKQAGEIPGIKCIEPQGAFYAFLNASKLFGKKTKDGKPINNSDELAAYLLQHARVAVVPGSAFGAGNYIRLSYATSRENIKKGLERIAGAVKELA